MIALAAVLFSGQLELTSGELVVGRGIYNETLSLDATVGVGAALGYYGRIFSIALAPHYVPDHALGLEGGSFSQLDVGVQLGIHTAIKPRIELFANLTPAYSTLFDGQLDDATGVALTVTGGAMYRLSSRMQVGAGVSYQYGNQHTGEGMLAATRLLGFSVFVMSR